ncbi:Lrp/AsnC ligand binding domain-containing protein [Nonomuraea sp. NPDC049269]|uniref:Lrp/AsnC ligand binding domain-containing protein n=1 Tax=Nonomuraea sp. NPDC049269 TaxID=3364349 RepID=UPI003711E444
MWASVPALAPRRDRRRDRRTPEVAFCAATTGPTNLLVSAVCRDSKDLYRYLTDQIGALPLVHKVETAPVIRTVKRRYF